MGEAISSLRSGAPSAAASATANAAAGNAQMNMPSGGSGVGAGGGVGVGQGPPNRGPVVGQGGGAGGAASATLFDDLPHLPPSQVLAPSVTSLGMMDLTQLREMERQNYNRAESIYISNQEQAKRRREIRTQELETVWRKSKETHEQGLQRLEAEYLEERRKRTEAAQHDSKRLEEHHLMLNRQYEAYQAKLNTEWAALQAAASQKAAQLDGLMAMQQQLQHQLQQQQQIQQLQQQLQIQHQQQQLNPQQPAPTSMAPWMSNGLPNGGSSGPISQPSVPQHPPPQPIAASTNPFGDTPVAAAVPTSSIPELEFKRVWMDIFPPDFAKLSTYTRIPIFEFYCEYIFKATAQDVLARSISQLVDALIQQRIVVPLRLFDAISLAEAASYPEMSRLRQVAKPLTLAHLQNAKPVTNAANVIAHQHQALALHHQQQQAAARQQQQQPTVNEMALQLQRMINASQIPNSGGGGGVNRPILTHPAPAQSPPQVSSAPAAAAAAIPPPPPAHVAPPPPPPPPPPPAARSSNSYHHSSDHHRRRGWSPSRSSTRTESHSASVSRTNDRSERDSRDNGRSDRDRDRDRDRRR